jgi:hypothetical protein
VSRFGSSSRGAASNLETAKALGLSCGECVAYACTWDRETGEFRGVYRVIVTWPLMMAAGLAAQRLKNRAGVSA